MFVPSPDTDPFVAELDDAVQAHMDWTRSIIRCAVLRTTPDADVVDPHAHTLCRFGGWFAANRNHFDALDPEAAQRVDVVHQRMHDAMRVLFNTLSRCQAGSSDDLDAFETTQAELITLLAQFKTRALLNTVRHDTLTGLPPRHGIAGEYAHLLKEAGRSGSLLYVVMIDVDHFKPINDNYGHPTGDQVLRHVAHTLKQGVRGGEPLYRFGGEEFLWLLKCRSPEEARKSARRILASVGTTPVPIDDGETLRLTITMGLALAGEREDLSSAIRRADMALYEGKQNGRNRYVVADAL
ncbi:MAG: diguanylate cyclase [Thiobacillus sp.]|nr:diguanylate cyclase [Thiobacillus sp.]